MKLNAYLTFDGNCQEAMLYYKDVLDAEVSLMTTFGDGPMEVPESHKDKIMHIHLKGEDFELMASDSDGRQSVHQGNNCHLSLSIEDPTKAAEVYAKLSAGGQAIMPFEEVFWGGRFGMCQDRFGIYWMVSSS